MFAALMYQITASCKVQALNLTEYQTDETLNANENRSHDRALIVDVGTGLKDPPGDSLEETMLGCQGKEERKNVQQTLKLGRGFLFSTGQARRELPNEERSKGSTATLHERPS